MLSPCFTLDRLRLAARKPYKSIQASKQECALSIDRHILAASTLAVGKSERIAREIEADIRAGRISHGDRLASENELVQRYSVSRSTVRKSLETLSSRGLIVTRMGVGSFVAFHGQTIDNSVGWSRSLADAGVRTEVRLLRAELVQDPALASELGMQAPDFLAIERVRSIVEDGTAVSLERSHLPLTPALEEVPLRGLRDGSIHETLRAAGLVPDHGEEWAELHRLTPDEAKILVREPGAAVLRTRRLVHARDGQVIEYVVSLLDPDHFALHLEF